MINNIIVNNVNACSADGSAGGNQSPELSWTRANPGTRSFVVTAYDVTAAFTHWGMYNISSKATGFDPKTAGFSEPHEVKFGPGSTVTVKPDDDWTVRSPGLVFSRREDVSSSVWLMKLPR